MNNYEWLSRAREIISERSRTADIGDAYYPVVHGDEDELDDPLCWDCLVKKHGEDADYRNYGAEDLDHCSHCAECGVILEFYLTEYGAEEEIDHFHTWGFDWSDADDCYHIDAAIDAFYGMGAWKLSNMPRRERDRLFRLLRRGDNLPDELKPELIGAQS